MNNDTSFIPYLDSIKDIKTFSQIVAREMEKQNLCSKALAEKAVLYVFMRVKLQKF